MALLGCWIAGSFLGIQAARAVSCVSPDALRMMALSEPSPGALFVTALFPLFYSACAVMIFQSRACYWCGLVHGAGQGFALSIICSVWQTGGMLLAFLLMFSRLCTNPVLLCYWLRRIESGNRFLVRDTALCALLCLGIGCVDCGIIVPFLADAIY